jgi:nucleotide-binding universal stress UspA family protein
MAAMYTSIVVGIDGSPTAEIALARAIELAGAADARLHVLSAYEPAPARVTGGAPAGEEYQGSISPTFKVDAVLERALGSAAAKGITVEQHAPKGAAADAIVRVAEEKDADLIVIGSVGMQGAKRIFGSVPNKVSHRAPCDLLIVQTAER